jgi:hypothetical protein
MVDLRADAALGHAWLEKKNLVTILGTTYVNSKDIYEDFAVQGSVAAYFPGVTAELCRRLGVAHRVVAAPSPGGAVEPRRARAVRVGGEVFESGTAISPERDCAGNSTRSASNPP